ncbi:hypothetical protein C0J52_20013 [Blattella germanica]|nr:hypothetical protein C0J52_20013 [Blattella germanica]
MIKRAKIDVRTPEYDDDAFVCDGKEAAAVVAYAAQLMKEREVGREAAWLTVTICSSRISPQNVLCTYRAYHSSRYCSYIQCNRTVPFMEVSGGNDSYDGVQFTTISKQVESEDLNSNATQRLTTSLDPITLIKRAKIDVRTPEYDDDAFVCDGKEAAAVVAYAAQLMNEREVGREAAWLTVTICSSRISPQNVLCTYRAYHSSRYCSYIQCNRTVPFMEVSGGNDSYDGVQFTTISKQVESEDLNSNATQRLTT